MSEGGRGRSCGWWRAGRGRWRRRRVAERIGARRVVARLVALTSCTRHANTARHAFILAAHCRGCRDTIDDNDCLHCWCRRCHGDDDHHGVGGDHSVKRSLQVGNDRRERRRRYLCRDRGDDVSDSIRRIACSWHDFDFKVHLESSREKRPSSASRNVFNRRDRDRAHFNVQSRRHTGTKRKLRFVGERRTGETVKLNV